MAADDPLIAAYRAGATVHELAERFDVTPKTVRNRLDRAGVQPRRRGRPPQFTALQDRNWLAARYQRAGDSAAVVAAEVGCSETAVLEALHRHGIAVRGPGGGSRHTPMPQRLRDEEWLRARYASGASIRVIAAELGVSGTAVANALRRLGVARRPTGSPRSTPTPAPDGSTALRVGRRRRGVLGVLADGTEFYAPLGELEFVDDGTRVRCHLCGEAFRLLSATHLRGHEWTPAQYREAFGLNRGTALCAPAVSEQRRVAGRARYVADARVRDGLARGQAFVRSGAALRAAHAVMPAGSARLQRRRSAAQVTETARRRRQDEAVRRRRERMRTLGFATERAYLRDRYVQRGWGIARIRAELQVGSGVVEQMLDAVGVARRAPGGAGRVS